MMSQETERRTVLSLIYDLSELLNPGTNQDFQTKGSFGLTDPYSTKNIGTSFS